MELEFEKRSIRILTNHWGQKTSKTWNAVSTYHEPPKTGNPAVLLSYVVKLYRKRKSADCIVLGAGKTDYLFAMLQSLLPFRKIPCVIIDCLWYINPNKIKHLYKKIILKLISKSVDKFVVWSSREIKDYAYAFGIDENKFAFIPYHVTITDIQSFDGGYLFSGGNYDRDYQTLIKAVKGLPVSLKIACTRPEIFQGIEIPVNVDTRGYAPKEYRRVMAGCKINIVSMQPGLLHSGGQQTYLNSMWYGKPTIVNDPEGAKDYIDNGKDGILVPPGDPVALRNAIQALVENPARMEMIGMHAAERAKAFSTEAHFKKIVEMIEKDILK